MKGVIIKFVCFLLFSVAVNGSILGQYHIRGKIINSKTKDPLAFVNIVLNGSSFSEGVTDIDGKFNISTSTANNRLVFTNLGYETQTISLDAEKATTPLTISLMPSLFQLEEVVVKASENPANKIIRKVIENKPINNPEKVASFKYTCYNKMVFDLKVADSAGNRNMKQRMDSVLQGGHLFITEAVTERKYIAPDKSDELIIGTKVSGYRHPSFASLATDIQPFSFYNDLITILDVHYLNPISEGSLKKYAFTIEDTIFQNKDTVYIISFKPQSGKNFEGLTGLLYINTNKYAVQNVIATPFEKGLIDIKIQQKYEYIDNKQWFPTQLNFEMTMRQYPSKKVQTNANGKSYIKNIELLPPLDKKEFALEAIHMHELAADRDEIFWNQYRPEALNTREAKTYHVIDSVGRKNKFDAMMNIMEKLVRNRVPVKFIDIDLSQSLIYNKFEGMRLGTGIYTNEKVSKIISVGGFFGYGTTDHLWKYGEQMIFSLNKKHELELRGCYQNTLRESGRTQLNFFNQNYFDFRDYITYQMDRIKQGSASIGFRALKYAKCNIGVNHTIITPLYNYFFKTDDNTTITGYTVSDVSVKLRYAYKEKIINTLNERVSTGSKYPIVYLNYSKAIRNIYNGSFDFNKVELELEQSFLFRSFGETKIKIEGGYIDKPLPYGLLFTGQGSFSKDLPFIMKNYFQTMTPYEFLSDRYAIAHFSHSFGSLLFKTDKFKPTLTIHQNAGWGMLSHPEKQQLMAFKTMEKGFYESGLQVDNILKVNYANIAYLGIGVGAFYRYGPYAFNNASDNLALKLSFSFTTK
jgi:hypothetical protein